MLNAQMAGAVAVIIYNNNLQESTIDMAAGDDGGSVTIPGVMIDNADGLNLIAALDLGLVTMTIGYPFSRAIL